MYATMEVKTERASGLAAHQILGLVALTSAVLACAAWGRLAVTSFPIIVIADGGLDDGAMERVRDAAAMFLISLTTAALALRLLRPPALRLVLAAVVLAVLAWRPFESDSFRQEARWPSMAILGLTMVAAVAESRQARGRPASPLGVAGLALLLPALLVLTDWQARVSLGLLPAATADQDYKPPGARRSAGLLAGSDAYVAESLESRLRATGGKDAALTVEGLDGGPVFRAPARPDHMLQVLRFSPDGRVLAVADNNGNYEGSAITVWDVAPGGEGGPPSVVLRRTLGGLTHWTFALDFFPDGKTLVAANGDKTVRLWDTASGEELARFTAHRDRRGRWDMGADCVAAAPDGRSFATWGPDGIKVWDRDSRRLMRVLDAPGGLGCWMAFTPDGGGIIAADRTAACRWDFQPSRLPFLGLLMATVGAFLWLCWPYIARPGRQPRSDAA